MGAQYARSLELERVCKHDHALDPAGIRLVRQRVAYKLQGAVSHFRSRPFNIYSFSTHLRGAISVAGNN